MDIEGDIGSPTRKNPTTFKEWTKPSRFCLNVAFAKSLTLIFFKNRERFRIALLQFGYSRWQEIQTAARLKGKTTEIIQSFAENFLQLLLLASDTTKTAALYQVLLICCSRFKLVLTSYLQEIVARTTKSSVVVNLSDYSTGEVRSFYSDATLLLNAFLGLVSQSPKVKVYSKSDASIDGHERQIELFRCQHRNRASKN